MPGKKGWSHGVRETHVLIPMWQEYLDAAREGYKERRRVLRLICERYHFQVPVETTFDQDVHAPLPLWTPETQYNPYEGLTTPAERETRRATMAMVNTRIERWYAYRYSRLQRELANST
ncbi:hypothetical protein EV121DRAFT_298102 [Schizophyllum commune]